MSDDSTNQDPHLYEVRLTEPAEGDIEAVHERLSELVSPQYADRWQDALLAEIGHLDLFPTSYAVAAELGVDTSQRSSGAKVKTLMITDPDGNHIAFAEAIDQSIAR